MPRSHRLTRASDLRAVLREGKRIRTEHLELRAVASLLPHPRVGFVVPKHRHGSVERNRLKRRLREIARTWILPALGDAAAVDLVVRTRPEAYRASFDRLAAELDRALPRLTSLPRLTPPPRPGPAGPCDAS